MRTYKLKDIVTFGLGLTYTPVYRDEGVIFISSKNLSNDYLNLTDVSFISIEDYNSISKNAKPQKGDILFTRVGSNLGHPVIYDGKKPIAIFVSVGYLRVKKYICNEYIKYWMQSKSFWRQVDSQVSGSSKMNLNIGWMSNFKIVLPTLNKQYEVSFVLHTIDDRINTQKKIIESLKSQINQIRCDFFKKIDSCEKKISISKITEEYISKTNKNNMYPVLSSTQNGIYLQSLYFNKEASSEDTTGYKIIPRGFCTYRSMSDSGVFKFNKQNILDYGIISPAYPVFKTNEMFLTDYFIEYLNYSYYFKNKVLETKEGGTRYALSFSKLKKIEITYVSKDKQKKYLNVINTFLNKLTNEVKILSLYEKQKQYLLNHMFI